MYDSYQHAADFGVSTIHANPKQGLNGLDTRTPRGAPTIHLRPWMITREERSVLAHKLVHVEHDDQLTADGTWDARRERRYERIAASRLINRHNLQELALAYDDRGI